ncbi:putative histidinol-phosphatase [Amylocarpus encephaloides]|uniref:Histidinol-phosphatase n=1 Tax=Amylocarpus encephaloides TaxID=45428 RepID=A0A9P7YHH3_9HELO|nr:putative histidinol-phosphatase [Amylocarpus encephaloides]
MAFSMHSHSGQFCPGHAEDTLEDFILTAIARGMKTFACTEHMPRESEEDLYPEEIAAGHTISDHLPLHAAYLTEAVRLRTKYASQITLLVGFEAEWIRSSYGPFISQFSSDPRIDFFIGSVHHVHGIPIDYDKAMYAKAVEKSGSEEGLCGDYYDAQFEMLSVLKPRVVGHFDLIRLLAEDPNKDLKSIPRLWEKAVRNLKLIKEQDGLLEINSAGLRKGLREPYPGQSICEMWVEMGGKFTLSDDSHAVAQVGTNYGRIFRYMESLGVEDVWTLERVEKEVRLKRVGMDEARASFRD